MSDKIYKFSCPWNTATLLSEFDSDNLTQVSSYNPTWKKYNTGMTSYAMTIADSFTENVYLGYYYQESGTAVNKHTDTVAQCRINVMLKGGNETLHMADSELVYDCALLNVSQYEHYVDTVSEDRLMFSIIFYEDDYASVKSMLQTYSYS